MLDRFSHLGFVFFEDANIVNMLHFVQLDIFALRQIRYNRPNGRFRYDINPTFAKQTYRVNVRVANSHIERRRRISKITQGIYIDVKKQTDPTKT